MTFFLLWNTKIVLKQNAVQTILHPISFLLYEYEKKKKKKKHNCGPQKKENYTGLE